MNRQERIAESLRQALAPQQLDVVDESSKHAGHAGARPEGETHYRLRVTSAAFAGKSRVECHRMINAVLKAEFDNGLHALAIEAHAATAD